MPTFANPAEREEILRFFSGRFGIPETAFEGLCLLREKQKVWVAADLPGIAQVLEKLRVETAGVPLLRTKKSVWKPTTCGLQLLGHLATRNVVDLAGEELEAFFRERTLEGPFPLEPGFVIVRAMGRVLGCAVYGKGKLRSQIPQKRGEPFKGGTASGEP